MTYMKPILVHLDELNYVNILFDQFDTDLLFHSGTLDSEGI